MKELQDNTKQITDGAGNMYTSSMKYINELMK